MLLVAGSTTRHQFPDQMSTTDLDPPLGTSSPCTASSSRQPHRPRPICLPLLLLILVFLPASSDAFVRRPNNGLLKLCPPGGESFTAAWEITCGMRRRKRSVEAPNEDLPNVEEAGKADLALQQPDDDPLRQEESAAPPKNLWISLRDFLFGIKQTETDQPGKVLSRKERTTAEEEEGNKIAEAKLVKIQDPSTTAAMGNSNHLYRAPSMTEMMLFCCRYGCSLRDLMPYCDPFGEWDS